MLTGALLTLLAAALVPAAGQAAITTFGSPLAVPATLNTAEHLSYSGTYTQVPPAPDAPNGTFHTFHYGADTALWNFSQPGGETRVPATGQALKIEVEGCAQPAPRGPRPLTTVHFQDLTPLAGGGAQVNITSQGFDLPVCGDGGANGSTITTYVPVNLCVSAGDYVAFNDSGGYVPNIYRSGVPYQVLGAVTGATTDSFIKDQGTGNGATLSPAVTSANDGFAVNRNVELMMRVTLGTGPDATHICPGGKHGLPLALAPIHLSPQTDGVNHSRVTAVAIFCRPANGCQGVATLTPTGRQASKSSWGRTAFALPGRGTAHVPIRVARGVIKLLRRQRAAGVRMALSVVAAGKTYSQTITLKIF
ncbi:MAG TPA: hypothetical protein VK538_04795 [Solirubrobacteraceae bacterium]|nr:hypothetical protein [Solirubrobacteraceae bacterium]